MKNSSNHITAVTYPRASAHLRGNDMFETETWEDQIIKEWLEKNLEPFILRWLRKELTNEEVINKLDELMDREDIPRFQGSRSAPANDIIRGIRQDIIRHSEQYEHKARAYFQKKNSSQV
jgi:hypothetical protein